MTCPECGTDRLPRTRFCHNCGWDSKLAAAGSASSVAGQRPAWKRRLMSGTLAAFTGLLLLMLLMPRSGADISLSPGEMAPDFTLQSLDGEMVRLSDLRGQPVVLNFWASWCTPCRREMPHFEALYSKYREAGLKIYGINLGESAVAAADFQRRTGFTFPVLLDSDDRVQTDYRILPIPATFFIDRQGVIRAVYQYQMNEAQMEREALQLLAR